MNSKQGSKALSARSDAGTPLGFLGLLALGLVLVLAQKPAWAQSDQAPAQEVFTPAAQKGPVVVVLSGQTGTTHYRKVAAQLAGLGYYTVLVDGKEILNRSGDGAKNLRATLAQAGASDHALPGKAAVIGFSQGGGGALAHAAGMPDQVSVVVAYYPAVSWIKNFDGFAARIKVPTLVLAAEQDRYNNCCLIGSMRELEAGAKAHEAPLELVTYPNADHGFNLEGRGYRAADTADAWRRTTDMLARHQPLK